MATNGFRLGEWKVTCDRCGHFWYASQLRKEWTGLMTCSGPGTNNCHEQRHSQDFVRGVRDRQSPEWVRPDPPDVFTTHNISGATQANPVVITTDAAHGFANGETVWIEDVEGMTEINNRRFTIANVTSTTFELQGEDGTGHTAYSDGGRASVDVKAGDL